jgi:hypothetical protein
LIWVASPTIKLIFLRFNLGASSKLISSALRQPTANHGFDGSVSICTTAHSETALHDWENFCTNGGGPIVVGAVQGASCFGPAYEFASYALISVRAQN